MNLAFRLDDIDAALVRRVNAMLYLGRRFPNSPGYFRDAGEALLELRQDRPQALWLRIVRDHCGLSRSRAYELTVIGNRGKTLEQVRSETSARARKHRRDKWLPTKAPRKTPSKSQL